MAKEGEISDARERETKSRDEPFGNASEPDRQRRRVSEKLGESRAKWLTHKVCSRLGSKPAARPSSQGRRRLEGSPRKRAGLGAFSKLRTRRRRERSQHAD